MVCRGWQRQAVCAPCLSLWRPAVPRCPRCAIALPVRTDIASHTHTGIGLGGGMDEAPAPPGQAPGKAPPAQPCQACDDQSPEFDRAIAALDYTAPWSPLLMRLKFQGATALARPLGDLLARAAMPRRGRVTLVLPVPLSCERLRERGYNQSWLLARRVAQGLRLPARHDLLTRTRHTARLMALSAEARAQAIHDVFDVAPMARDALRGRHVALVDDVMTTGATLNEATRALLEGGARGVSVWVVARTPPPADARPGDEAPFSGGRDRAAAARA